MLLRQVDIHAALISTRKPAATPGAEMGMSKVARRLLYNRQAASPW
jgi:hypothetical protein